LKLYRDFDARIRQAKKTRVSLKQRKDAEFGFFVLSDKDSSWVRC